MDILSCMKCGICNRGNARRKIEKLLKRGIKMKKVNKNEKMKRKKFKEIEIRVL